MDNHLYYQFQVLRHQLNKLQALKSSFQAWKCVSFGYALLATVLLSAKWHEVSTDLRLLNGIDQLLWQTGNSHPNASLAGALAEDRASSGRHNKSSELTGLQWEPALALELLSSVNSSGDLLSDVANANASTDQSASMLVSHMQLTLGRELNGNQLLKQEVETFLGEFRCNSSSRFAWSRCCDSEGPKSNSKHPEMKTALQ